MWCSLDRLRTMHDLGVTPDTTKKCAKGTMTFQCVWSVVLLKCRFVAWRETNSLEGWEDCHSRSRENVSLPMMAFMICNDCVEKGRERETPMKPQQASH